MPLSPAHKQRSRQRILDTAVILFTQHGFDNTSIDQVMQQANMTRGAFYAHFASKSDLYQQALSNAATHSMLARIKPDDMDDREWVYRLLDAYLSTDHVNGKQGACPLAFLSTDIAIREPQVRKTYTQTYKNMNRLLGDYVKSFSNCNEQDLLAITAMIIGGVAIARAVNDKSVTRNVLQACRAKVQQILEDDGSG